MLQDPWVPAARALGYVSPQPLCCAGLAPEEGVGGSFDSKELGQSPLPMAWSRDGCCLPDLGGLFRVCRHGGAGCCVGSTGTNWVLSPQPDLISTIGESAALGAAGAIFWGDADYTRNRVGLGSVPSWGGS